jgi:hypothetical protein
MHQKKRIHKHLNIKPAFQHLIFSTPRRHHRLYYPTLFFDKVNSVIFDRFWDDWTFIGQKWSLLQYIRAQILKANFIYGIYLGLIYWSYSWVQKHTRRDPSVAFSFREILNFLRPKTCIKFHWSMPWNLLSDLNLKAFMQFF